MELHKMKRLWLIPAFLLLGGCVTTPIGSVIGGECKLPGLHTPTYEVKGRTTYDQGWITDVTVALVAGCKQPRPKARPAELDKAAPKTPGTIKVAPPAPAKIHWWQKFRRS